MKDYLLDTALCNINARIEKLEEQRDTCSKAERLELLACESQLFQAKSLILSVYETLQDLEE